MIEKLAVFVLTYHKHSKEHLERCFWSIDSQRDVLGLDGLSLRKVYDDMIKYLAQHRKVFYEKQS